MQTREAAAGWLRLERDRRATRLPQESPADATRRRTLQWNEAIRYRSLLQRQDRELDAARRQERLEARGAVETGAAATTRMQGLLMELEAQRRSQRVQMTTDRLRRGEAEVAPVGPRRPVRPGGTIIR